MKIKFTVHVHSNRDIEKPEAFKRGVFEQFTPIWETVKVDGQTMKAVSPVFIVEPDFDPEMLFDSITPVMYDDNMDRSYTIIQR